VSASLSGHRIFSVVQLLCNFLQKSRQVRGASRIMRMASWMCYFTGFSSPVRVRKLEK
jgi:hypothetical protein